MFLIQWNINGYHTHLDMLKILTNKYSPLLICIQETRFTDSKTTSPKSYNGFFKNRDEQPRAGGGVAIYIKNNIEARQLPITSQLEAVFIEITFKQKLNICNIYIPPNKYINLDELNRLITQIPTPRIIVGDFNGHNVIWGSTTTNKRGKTLEEFINVNHLALLNTGEPTRLDTFSGHFSSIDLSMCDPSISHLFSCETSQNPYGSDHLPILITHNQDTSHTSTVHNKWRLDKADWGEYTTALEQKLLNFEIHPNINTTIETFNNIIIEIALATIGKTTPKNSSMVEYRDRSSNSPHKNIF